MHNREKTPQSCSEDWETRTFSPNRGWSGYEDLQVKLLLKYGQVSIDDYAVGNLAAMERAGERSRAHKHRQCFLFIGRKPRLCAQMLMNINKSSHSMLLISNARSACSPTQLYDPCAWLGGGGGVGAPSPSTKSARLCRSYRKTVIIMIWYARQSMRRHWTWW